MVNNIAVQTGTVTAADILGSRATDDAYAGANIKSITAKSVANNILSAAPTIADNKISYTSNTNLATKHLTDTYDVVLEFTNVNDLTITLSVKTVDKTPVTITGVAVAGKTYDGTTIAKTGTPTAKTSDATNVTSSIDSWTYLYESTDGSNYSSATAPKNAGAYKLTISAVDTAYEGKQEINFTIAKKSLTVTADNHTIYYCHTLPNLTLRYHGFITGETAETALTSNTYAATTIADGKCVGTFDITISGSAIADNYTFSTQKGTLTVLPRVLTPATETMSAQPTRETVALPAGSVPTGSNLSDLQLAVSYTVTAVDNTALNTATSGKTAFNNKINLEISLIDTGNGNVKVQPNGEITIFIPYPSGTDNQDAFKLLHLKDDGSTEDITPIKLTNGLKFTVSSLSPFSLGWVKHDGPSGDDDDNNYDYYTITATAGAGGTISTGNSVFVREGDSADFTFTPNKGYQIADVLVNGKSVGAVKTYTFTNVRSNQTIHVTFKASSGHVNPQTGVTLADVPEND